MITARSPSWTFADVRDFEKSFGALGSRNFLSALASKFKICSLVKRRLRRSHARLFGFYFYREIYQKNFEFSSRDNRSLRSLRKFFYEKFPPDLKIRNFSEVNFAVKMHRFAAHWHNLNSDRFAIGFWGALALRFRASRDAIQNFASRNLVALHAAGTIIIRSIRDRASGTLRVPRF